MGLEWVVNGVMLAFCSIQDIREKEISLWKLKVYGILGRSSKYLETVLAGR